ncbi:MAG: DUF4476 domain-containing protein [Bacteroidia bacterium]|nr:DUF4476 domain-containing protein [Bacteroidia bacterium]
MTSLTLHRLIHGTFFLASMLPMFLFAQPETLTNPAKALQGYTGESYCSLPISELDFETFFIELKALPNDRLRFEKVRSEVADLCLATPYVYRMMELMENSSHEYDMMRICFYYCADPGNYERLLPFMQAGTYREGMEIFLRERVQSQRPAVEGQRQLFNSSELDRALIVMRALDSDQSRLYVALEILRFNNLLCEQVRPLIELIQLGKNRMDFARQAYEYVYDPANFFLVTEKLSRKEREEVMASVNQSSRSKEPGYQTTREIGCTYRVAESEFVRHLGSLQAQQSESLKLRLAQQLFQNNCFNVSELKRAMQIFETDTDRIELAKVAFDHVFDPWNIYMVNADLLRASSIDTFFLYLKGR